jgi:hypothetical protein
MSGNMILSTAWWTHLRVANATSHNVAMWVDLLWTITSNGFYNQLLAMLVCFDSPVGGSRGQ